MRKKIVAGNWKMNLNAKEAKKLIKEIAKYTEKNKKKMVCKVIVAPSFTSLLTTKKQASGTGIKIAAQNMHQADCGAYTGEISADMLKSIKVRKVILGHSERRQYFGETDELLAQKVRKAIDSRFQVIFCNGETLEQRKSGIYLDVVAEQTKKALFGLSVEEIKKVVIAYEPVWAIGTGETATADQAQEIHAHLRKILADQYGQETADSISILYGGSVKPTNAKELFSKPDVDGGLIGGAALKADDFIEIIKACK
ncbi:MAG: triose-phosphate isomerase [Flavobacteriales bacterium]